MFSKSQGYCYNDGDSKSRYMLLCEVGPIQTNEVIYSIAMNCIRILLLVYIFNNVLDFSVVEQSLKKLITPVRNSGFIRCV